ncbi:glyceraldehyde 3-phosphate dehydrogenase NAD-binding domain-containing protein, partial [Arthrospira platensis SPKY2]
FDSTHGRFPLPVDASGGRLAIDGRDLVVTHETTPDAVDWAGLGIDLLVECSGRYGSRPELERFIAAGCPRVLLSQPGNSAEDVDATVVFGINHDALIATKR